TLKIEYSLHIQDVRDMGSRYADTPREACFHFSMEVKDQETPETAVEVKAGSGKCLAKCASTARGKDPYL
ncbi:MAG: hypothetical protein NC489_46230, partial [Ruminococcus flavefaciens]|nr:hypothetical protein [Ruminococcus flavefaciens]